MTNGKRFMEAVNLLQRVADRDEHEGIGMDLVEDIDSWLDRESCSQRPTDRDRYLEFLQQIGFTEVPYSPSRNILENVGSRTYVVSDRYVYVGKAHSYIFWMEFNEDGRFVAHGALEND